MKLSSDDVPGYTAQALLRYVQRFRSVGIPGLALGLLVSADPAGAQTDPVADEPVEEIVTIGTRVEGRTATETTVAIDIIGAAEISTSTGPPCWAWRVPSAKAPRGRTSMPFLQSPSSGLKFCETGRLRNTGRMPSPA